MNDLVALIFNPYGVAYLLIVAGSQLGYRQWQKKHRDRITTQRRTRGLPPTTLLYKTEHHSWQRRHAAVETVLWLTTVLAVPILLLAIARIVESNTLSTTAEQNNLALTVAIILGLTLISSRQSIQAFVGGLAFRLIAAFTRPFELGDRILLHSRQPHSHQDRLQGRVIQLSSFFITLETLSTQRINVPTHTLWHTAITVINEYSQASLCEIVFYVSTHITSTQQQVAEDILLDTARASAYVDPSRLIEVHCKQTLHAIQLTAVAYVAATENASAFTSDVTRQFLGFARRKQIPLASSQYIL